MRIGHLLLGAAIVIIVAGCQRQEEAKAPAPAPAAPAAEAPAPAPVVPEGFRHDAAFDASGYYMTRTPVTAGSYQLRTLAVGAPSDFEQWEAGGRDVFGPILFDFEDVSSPVQTNELGGEVHTGQVRVLPESYSFGPGEVTFRGRDPKLGEVVFSGSFDQAALAAAKQTGSSTQPVLTGSLQVGSERIRNISFTYWVGD